MVDAILFMTIMLVASAVVIGSSTSSTQYNHGLQQYVGDFAGTVLSVELSGLEYKDTMGRSVNLGDSPRSIGQLLCDEAVILGNGGGDSDFSDYNAVILAACRHMVRPGLGFSVSCNDGSVLISDTIADISELPETRSASQLAILPDGAGSVAVTITVHVWVI